MKVLRNIILMAAVLSLSSCYWEGTDTGNPQFGSLIGKKFSGIITESVCEIIDDCFRTHYSQLCKEKLPMATGITRALGFSEPHEVLADLNRVIVQYSRNNLLECITALESITCNDSLLEEAYGRSDPANFNSVYNLFNVSTLCSQVHSSP